MSREQRRNRARRAEAALADFLVEFEGLLWPTDAQALERALVVVRKEASK